MSASQAMRDRIAADIYKNKLIKAAKEAKKGVINFESNSRIKRNQD